VSRRLLPLRSLFHMEEMHAMTIWPFGLLPETLNHSIQNVAALQYRAKPEQGDLRLGFPQPAGSDALGLR